VNRYYCDFCKKGGCSGGHIAKHERSCTRNPNRVCGVCREAHLEQKPTADLLAALKANGVEGVQAVASGCPACVMAAIHALRKEEPLEQVGGGEYDNYIDFNYRTAADAFWAERSKEEMYY
jgi:hypothetical protein